MTHVQNTVKGFTDRIKATSNWGIYLPRYWFNLVVFGEIEGEAAAIWHRIAAFILVPFFISGSIIRGIFSFIGIIAQAIAFPVECFIAKMRDTFGAPPPESDMPASGAENQGEPNSTVTNMVRLMVSKAVGNKTLDTMGRLASLKETNPEEYDQCIQALASGMSADEREAISNPQVAQCMPEEIQSLYRDVLLKSHRLPPAAMDFRTVTTTRSM